ncbi:MAG TPA: hypothetical protein VN763_11400, partial [Saprospiraceae bacterium]|nr:hypothetical protein [Saprospiraceae bacterium]
MDLNPDVKAKQNEFMMAFTSHQGPIKGLWKQLEKDNVLPAETIKAVKLTFDLGTLTRNHIPLVAELRTMFQRGEIKSKRELAKNSVEDWQQILKRQRPDGVPVGFPPNIDGDNDDTKIREFAGILEQRFERSYPTTAFAGKLSRTEGSPVNLKKDVVRFIENNPTFQLDRYRLDHYLVENTDALKDITDKEGTVKELKSVQRVFRLQPTFKVVDALLSAKLDSAQKIYFMGKEQFMHTMEAKGINKLDAKKLYQKSEISYTMALAFFGKYNKAVNGVEPFGIPSQVEDAEAKAKISVLPNLQTLFGSLDYCECTHCRSVYSPAAYFVDVMHFLNE